MSSDFDIILDKSQQNLREVPSRILQMYNLKMLYLQNNHLVRLPEDFFLRLHQLTWLDLRDNRLTEIPENIAFHHHLENLLLSNNRIEMLPNEMGLVPQLKVLQIADNPILYPPRKILVQGTKTVCAYLKAEYDRMNPPLTPHLKETDEPKHTEEPLDPLDERYVSDDEEVMFVNYSDYPLKTVPSLTVKGISTTTKQSKATDEKIVHKISKGVSKISLKSYYNSSKYVKVNATQTSNQALVAKASLQADWVEKLRNLLLEQERILQQEKNLKSLDSWREVKKKEPIREFGDPDTIIKPPYDTNPEYNALLSREDLSAQIDKMVKQNNQRKAVKKDDVDKMINELMGQLKTIEETYREIENPREEVAEAGKQIRTIVDIHKKLLRLQETSNGLLH